jgi:hypothetical protein
MNGYHQPQYTYPVYNLLLLLPPALPKVTKLLKEQNQAPLKAGQRLLQKAEHTQQTHQQLPST